MKKQIIALLATVCMTLSGGAALAENSPRMEGHQHAMGTAMESAHADVKMHQACPHCGMDREKFAHSRMLITYSDGTSVGVCSIHCVITELKANKDKTIKMVEVADLNTKKLVDAEKATWVIGGSKKGVMTRNPKWAFALKADAVAFISKNGGQVATYKDVLSLAGKE